MTVKSGSRTTLRGAWAIAGRYGVAALSVVVAFAIKIALPPFLMASGTAELIFALAVLLAAWNGGLGPGFFAAALILQIAWPSDPSAPNLIRVAVLFTLCLMCSISMGLLRRSRELAVSESAARRARESSLRRSDAFQSAVLNSAFDCIITVDEAGRIVEFNPAAEQAFGLSRAEARDRRLAELVNFLTDDPGTEAGRDDLSAAAQFSKLAAPAELMARRKDETEFPIELAIAPFGVDGERFFAAFLREITARKRLEDELRRQTDELREGSRRKDEFIAMLAHELRNPLAAISGAFAISARSPVAEDLEWSRLAIDRNIKQLARLIDDLLDVSRVTRGKIELRKERFDVATVIDQAVDSIQYLLAPKGHQLGVSVARGSLWVDADAARLQQILANLLTNAIQYSEPASYISLRAQRREAEIVIRVRDNGQGIRSDLLPHVFDLFTQGDRSLARTEGGLGIGLTMVKALAEMHGGSITAASDGPGKGSEFILCLPSAERLNQPVTSQPSSSQPGQRRGNRILVVDDNVDLTRALTTLLSRFGYEVQAVYDGYAAIEAARIHQPEVVLLDIGLPGMDGYEVARRLRVEEGFRDTTIIAITGYGQEDGYDHSRAEGFNHHLIKPVQIETLVALLADPGQKTLDPSH